MLNTMTKTTTTERRQRLQTVRDRDYQAGLEAGQKTAAGCNDWADVHWHQRVVFDNLFDSRPHYVAGYIDGFAR